MLYADATRGQREFEQFDFTLSSGMSGNTFFLNNIEALDRFYNFLLEVFAKRDRYHFDRMVGHFLARKRNRLPGGACDMTAFAFYNEAHFGEFGEIAQRSSMDRCTTQVCRSLTSWETFIDHGRWRL